MLQKSALHCSIVMCAGAARNITLSLPNFNLPPGSIFRTASSLSLATARVSRVHRLQNGTPICLEQG